MLSVFNNGAAAACPRPFNLAAYVLARGAERPDKVALCVLGLSGAERWSYSRLIDAVRGTGTGLAQLGLNPGDKVLMRIGNSVEFPIAYLGAIAAGLVPIPTSSQLTEPEVQRIINITRPAAILLGDQIACPDSEIVTLTQDQLEAMRNLPASPWNMGDPNRPAYIIFTSGTSGTPRAVVHAHRAIWARRLMHDGWYVLTETDRMLHAGAFNWTYTLGTGLMDPWTVGATALIPEQGIQPEQIPLLLKRHDATIFAAAPGVYRKLLNNVSGRFPHLRHGLSAGEKLSDRIRDAWTEATGTPIFEAYGMSECSTFISGSPAHPSAPGTLGRPQDGRLIALLDEDGEPVRLGDEGTIAVHRSDPGLMLEYLGEENATSEKFRGDWFLTGDQGDMDADYQITYHGRSDDMMNAGGYRVSPIEVENAMLSHPGISACAVTDIEVKRDARVIMAFYTGPKALPEQELQAHAAAQLAKYKQPRGFYHVDALPTGANNKIIRRNLRPLYEALHGQA